MNTATDAMENDTPKSSGGFTVGQSASDLIGFYGATNIVQPSGSAQCLLTDSSVGVASSMPISSAIPPPFTVTLGGANATILIQSQGGSV